MEETNCLSTVTEADDTLCRTAGNINISQSPKHLRAAVTITLHARRELLSSREMLSEN